MSVSPTRLTALLATVVCALAVPAVAQVTQPGFGHDKRPPAGSPFSLPAGLEIAGPIVGADDDGNCPGRQTEDVGSGLWVRVCVPVRNRTGGGVQVIFPAGLVVVSALESHQHGLLVEQTVLTVPPFNISGNRLKDKDDDVVHVPLHLYCINEPRSPTTPGIPYSLGPVVAVSGGIAEILELMKSRDVRNDGTDVETVQEALYEVIREGRLSEETRQALTALD